ncbi:MAG: ATP-dependent helicase, partial [Planctomycetes bacterium]|nr:ATP-dependent helicase [Planctomycetota bacterium]
RFGAEEDRDLAEERRLFFVGMTRARERLILSHARRRAWRGARREMAPSPFLREIEEQLLKRIERAPPGKGGRGGERQLRLFEE